MAKLVADYVLERVREWGVHRIFGYPEDGINGFLGPRSGTERNCVRPRIDLN